MIKVAPPEFIQRMQPALELGLGADHVAGAQQANTTHRVINLVSQQCKEADQYWIREDRPMYAAQIYRDENAIR